MISTFFSLFLTKNQQPLPCSHIENCVIIHIIWSFFIFKIFPSVEIYFPRKYRKDQKSRLCVNDPLSIQLICFSILKLSVLFAFGHVSINVFYSLQNVVS